MAEIIELREFQAARERAQRRRSDHQSLASALVLMRDNLAAAANQMRSASATDQAALLNRVEQLAAMIRYAMRMMGEDDESTVTPR